MLTGAQRAAIDQLDGIEKVTVLADGVAKVTINNSDVLLGRDGTPLTARGWAVHPDRDEVVPYDEAAAAVEAAR